jgi:glyoxylase-like metal-dependent hydrolase (beta-lactamase superfamily II)
MKPLSLAPGLCVLPGAVNTGVLMAGGRAVLFDCCETVTPARLAALGVRHVDWICCTQARRVHVAGAGVFLKKSAQLAAPAGERELLEHPDAQWRSWKNRWHIYHSLAGFLQIPAEPLPVAKAVREGDCIEWRGRRIRVLDTPGATDGAVSYLVEADGKTYAFCGDALCAPGQVWDLAALQKGYGTLDYHGFLGNRRLLIPALKKLGACGAAALVPAHGAPIGKPTDATRLTIERLERAWRNYASVSAMQFYFPEQMKEWADDPLRMKPARIGKMPEHVVRVEGTTFAVLSESGGAFVLDCAQAATVETLQRWKAAGRIASVDGCFVTHYHDDHVDALENLHRAFGCPILTDAHMAEILEHPRRFLLPCISPNPAPANRATRDGEAWTWREFRLTAYHFPGQTWYHSGLLVEGRGSKVFFSGDSLSPTGLDDYCAGNRNFLGRNRGLDACLALLRKLRPDWITNQHQDAPFHYTTDEIDFLRRALAEREKIFAELLPWEDTNFGTDEQWVRAYPYEQDAFAGGVFETEVQFTNHARKRARAEVEPVPPAGWRWDARSSRARITIPARSEGAARLRLTVPRGARAGPHLLPFRITWNGRFLGQLRHALVNVLPDA